MPMTSKISILADSPSSRSIGGRSRAGPRAPARAAAAPTLRRARRGRLPQVSAESDQYWSSRRSAMTMPLVAEARGDVRLRSAKARWAVRSRRATLSRRRATPSSSSRSATTSAAPPPATGTRAAPCSLAVRVLHCTVLPSCSNLASRSSETARSVSSLNICVPFVNLLNDITYVCLK